jgi:DNA replication licensing factor MCM2
MNQRLQLNEELDREDRQRVNMANRRVGAFYDEENEDDENEVLHNEMRRERMRMMMDNGNGMDGDENDPDREMQNMLDFEDVKGPLQQWLRKVSVIKYITSQFNQFLRNFRDPETGGYVYEDKIHEMCMNNKQSLEINFTHLSAKNPTLAIWLAEEPALILPNLSQVAMELISEVYPDYSNLYKDVFVRVKDLPVEDKLRDLRQVHLNALIKIRGVVTKRTGVFPELTEMYYKCMKCNLIRGPYMHQSDEDPRNFLG